MRSARVYKIIETTLGTAQYIRIEECVKIGVSRPRDAINTVVITAPPRISDVVQGNHVISAGGKAGHWGGGLPPDPDINVRYNIFPVYTGNTLISRRLPSYVLSSISHGVQHVCVFFPQFLNAPRPYGHRRGGRLSFTRQIVYFIGFPSGTGFSFLLNCAGVTTRTRNTHVVLFRLPANNGGTAVGAHALLCRITVCLFDVCKAPRSFPGYEPATAHRLYLLRFDGTREQLSSFSFVRVLSSESDFDPFFLSTDVARYVYDRSVPRAHNLNPSGEGIQNINY